MAEEEIGARVRARMKEILPAVTQAEVAAKIGLTPDAFSRSLNGKRAFSAVELVELAELLKTSVHWFVTGEPDPFAVRYAGRHTFDRRLREHMPMDWDSARPILDDVALAYIQAYGRDEPAQLTYPRASASEVRQSLVRSASGSFVRNLADHVESVFGVDVVRLAETGADFAIEVLGRRVIVIAETANWFRENFGIAHELAHVLQAELSEVNGFACDDPAAERRANAFAAELLLPADLVRSFDWSTVSPREIAELLWDTGVSTEMLSTRLASLQIQPGRTAVSALSMRTQALLRREHVPQSESDLITERMRDASTRRFPAHLVSAHRLGVAEGRLRAETLAWMLGVDVVSLEEELAPPVEPPDLDWLARELGLTD